ncbi:MAG: hypothetical protein AAB588_04170, partial [Patescibacteria group bacterium]
MEETLLGVFGVLTIPWLVWLNVALAALSVVLSRLFFRTQNAYPFFSPISISLRELFIFAPAILAAALV